MLQSMRLQKLNTTQRLNNNQREAAWGSATRSIDKFMDEFHGLVGPNFSALTNSLYALV